MYNFRTDLALERRDIYQKANKLNQIDGVESTEEEINEFCKEMPRYKRPRKIIFADIPRNPTGKIEKPKLREIYHSSNLIDDQNKS